MYIVFVCILQYQRESEKQEIGVEDPESRLPKSEDVGSEYEMEKDEDGLPHGMFSGKCEFCHKHVSIKSSSFYILQGHLTLV